MWEEDISLGWQKLPVGSSFLTRLSVCRENAGNHWETDLIMFSFFPISILWKVCSQSLLQLLNHSATSPFIPKPFFSCFLVGQSRARPPTLSVTFRVFQKCLCLFMCWNKISCRPTQSLVGGSETQKMYYFTYWRAVIKICQGSEGIWKYKQWFLLMSVS